ncbi:MAG: hypothetical protein KDC28_10810 [Saprospiraceae bacterium]|nr:hypothetical protein [Saprospiraceae bacterium]MCB9317716.1 hypothetical protein [Lewinellaceae bacterium]
MDEETPKTEKEKKKKKLGISKEAINIIRTTYRNNIDLTSIADSKANILMSLNSLMLTFLIPIVLSNLDEIILYRLYVPLILLAITCVACIIIAALATRPVKMGTQKVKADTGDRTRMSPFFFGNYYRMQRENYFEMLEETLAEPELILDSIKLDLYFLGRSIGQKYHKIRICFLVFILGISASALALIVMLITRN